MFDNILYWQDCDETYFHPLLEGMQIIQPPKGDVVISSKVTNAFTFSLTFTNPLQSYTGKIQHDMCTGLFTTPLFSSAED